MGAWIEIAISNNLRKSSTSLPSWERGLKFTPVKYSLAVSAVAPLVGAWIEIFKAAEIVAPAFVAPLVGAWIEIFRVQLS